MPRTHNIEDQPPLTRTPAGYIEACDQLKNDIGTSYWLRAAIDALEDRDPVDALKDAETLALLCQMRATEAESWGK